MQHPFTTHSRAREESSRCWSSLEWNNALGVVFTPMFAARAGYDVSPSRRPHTSSERPSSVPRRRRAQLAIAPHAPQPYLHPRVRRRAYLPTTARHQIDLNRELDLALRCRSCFHLPTPYTSHYWFTLLRLSMSTSSDPFIDVAQALPDKLLA